MATSRKTASRHYLYRTSFTVQERLVGGFVLGALAILIALVLGSESLRELRKERMVLYGRVSSAQGVGPDTLVTLSGIKAGSVSAVDITPENDILITLQIAERFRLRLRQDASAELTTLALFGKTQIDITPGSATAPQLPDGAELTIDQAPPLDQIIARLGPTVETLQKMVEDVSAIVAAVEPAKVQQVVDKVVGVSDAVDADTVRSLVGNAGDITRDVRSITARLEAGEGALGAALNDAQVDQDMRSGIRRLNETLDTARLTLAEARDRMAELEPVIGDAGAISGATREVTQQLPELVGGVRTAVGHVNLTLTTLNTELQQVPDLVLRLKLLLDETNRTLEGMQRIWPLSSAINKPASTPVIEPLPLND